MSVTGTAHLGQDGAMRFMLGLRGYIGPDPDKSLIRRHREDDPSDRAVGLMTAVGDSSSHGAPAPSAAPVSSDNQTSGDGGGNPGGSNDDNSDDSCPPPNVGCD
jgi:hypothetical protein